MSSGDDIVMCNITCNNDYDYIVTDIDTSGMCQDGNWTRNETVCIRSTYVSLFILKQELVIVVICVSINLLLCEFD